MDTGRRNVVLGRIAPRAKRREHRMAGVRGSRTLPGQRRPPRNGFEDRETHRDPSTPAANIRATISAGNAGHGARSHGGRMALRSRIFSPAQHSSQELLMSLHRMNSVTIGVPNVDDTRAFYRDFNLTETAPGVFASADGGEQLRIVPSPVRRVVEVGIGADDQDDLDRIESQLGAIGVAPRSDDGSVWARDPGTGVDVRVAVAPKLVQRPAPSAPYNGP